MRETLLTIPLTEVFEKNDGCPFCTMRNLLEDRFCEYVLGSAVMDPSLRSELNYYGFCKEHFDMLLKKKNRLGVALILQSHLRLLNSDSYDAKKKMPVMKNIARYNNSCFICKEVDKAMIGLLKTFFEQYSDENFHKSFMKQEFICFPHLELLMINAPKMLNKKTLVNFTADAVSLSSKYSESLSEDVTHFCNMYDYRNTLPNADWGNSKDSIERTIKFLTSR